ncbi:histidine kinase N-terminal 7TM domain-containing diguanylate cyclase [Aquitalea magnusonii]|uniref:diguanylate cyclase n=1 Tax=Aquitalea magnusonii TaxID=332411 RepID=A0A318JGI2_9NEIS|nr:histidine kinase N-terminal 7TM domain-containing protein [Aquitalea magnusonii]PXX49480.1 PAS domain S-box-containing protein/diguanylate cyclase (GGDEF)-like protein [Aquitalea magnusonii]
MSFVFTTISATAGLAALSAATIGILAWERRQVTGARWLAWLMLAVTIWAGSAMLELSSSMLREKIFWSKLEYLGTLSAPVLFFLLAADYNQLDKALRLRSIAMLFLIPLLSLALAISNERHGLIWSSYQPSPSGYNLLIFNHGPLFWLLVAGYSYLMMLLGSLLLLRTLHFYPPHYRGQSLILMLGAIVPWAGNLLYLSGNIPLRGLDPTPLCFAITGMVFAFDLLYLRMLYVVPIARGNAFNAMGDGIVVIDPNKTVLDINPAAANLFGKPAAVLCGQPLQIAALLAVADQDGAHQVELNGPGSRAILEVRAFPIRESGVTLGGRMLVLRDISRQRRAEEALHQAYMQLKNRIDEIETLQDTLREQALHDPLTGLYNRRYLEETLSREISRAEREQQPLTFALIDLDNFKGVNDRYGHMAGDQVLCALADLLRRHCRQADIVCRLGGEEFIVVLPAADQRNGWMRLEMLRRRFSDLRYRVEAVEFSSTFSCGIACYPSDGNSFAKLYQLADMALYEAKAHGKNQVRLHGNPLQELTDIPLLQAHMVSKEP